MPDDAGVTAHIIDPTTTHTHTIIFLHGRGDDGPGFAEEFLSSFNQSELEQGETLLARLPSSRWVFPSAPVRWSTVFEENLSAWFDDLAPSDSTGSGEKIQIDAIMDLVAQISEIIDDEVSRLGGRSDRIVLGGISQGAALALWVLLSQASRNPHGSRLGGFVGASCWLPFACGVKSFMANFEGRSTNIELNCTPSSPQHFMDSVLSSLMNGTGNHALASTPVFLGHGTDDAYVDVSLGREARDLLISLGFENLLWREYTGAEQEGHWFKEPEQFDDIANFLVTILTEQSPTM